MVWILYVLYLFYLLRPCEFLIACVMKHLFGSLPIKALECIIRWYSRLPHAKNWESHVVLKTMIPLYGIPHISAFLTGYFRILRISLSIADRTIFDSEGHEETEEKMVWTKSAEDALDFVRAGGGTSIEYIILEKDIEPSYIPEFVSYCPSIVTLKVYHSGKWISLCRRKIRRLVACTEIVLDIPRTWPELRHLTLLDKHGVMGCAEVWSRIGVNIELLWIYSDYMQTEDYRNISRWCRRLKSLIFEGRNRQNNEIANVLRSYGHQLLFTRFSSMPIIS